VMDLSDKAPISSLWRISSIPTIRQRAPIGAMVFRKVIGRWTGIWKRLRAAGLDPIDFRLKNALRAGEVILSAPPGARAGAAPETIETCGLEACACQGKLSLAGMRSMEILPGTWCPENLI